MLSIVICSANKQYLADLKLNIRETIGCAFEILAYQNEQGIKGICEVYNQGAKDAIYDLICYMHEDIKLVTQNWGNIVIKNFSENHNLGLMGVAGGDYKSLAPSSWFNFEAPPSFPGNRYINLLQEYKSENKEPVHELSNPKDQNLSQVACVDGVWMCTRKSIAQEIKFDEEMLRGFHGYDIDFSLAVGRKYTLTVTFQVLLKHFSEGKSSRGWVEDVAKVHKKWNGILPVNLTGSPLSECFTYEKHYFRNFLTYAKSMGLSYKSLQNIIHAAKKSPSMNTHLYLKLLWFVYKMNKKNP